MPICAFSQWHDFVSGCASRFRSLDSHGLDLLPHPSVRAYRRLPDFEPLADTTEASPFGQWFAGVAVATLLASYAIWCLITRHALFLSGRPIRLVEFDGPCATAIGILYLCIAAFMHLHWFWTASPRFWGYAQLGKMIAAAGVIGSLAFFFIAALVWS